MQISVVFGGGCVYAEGGKDWKRCSLYCQKLLASFQYCKLLSHWEICIEAACYSQGFVLSFFLIWEKCECLLKWGDWQCVLLSGPVEADTCESFPLQLCQCTYLNCPLQLPQYSWFLRYSCNYKVLFGGGEASEGWECLSVQRHSESFNVFSQLS